MTVKTLTFLNLSLLILFPISWVAPLMRAGLLPLFSLDEISVLSGLWALIEDQEWLLAIAITLFALIAPILKTVGLALVHLQKASPKWLPSLATMGKLAMADVFLIAIYITLAKGIGVGRVETAWGLWLFTACVLASFVVSLLTSRLVKEGRLG